MRHWRGGCPPHARLPGLGVGRRSRTAATASPRLSRAPAANASSNRSAPSAWRTWATTSASPRRSDGQARRPTRRRRPSAAPASSAARSASPSANANPANAARQRVTPWVPRASRLKSSPACGPGRPGRGPGGVGPGALLEQHRRQPQRGDGALHRAPFGGELALLADGGAHEHPQPPVGGPDDHVSPQPLRSAIVPGERHRASLERAPWHRNPGDNAHPSAAALDYGWPAPARSRSCVGRRKASQPMATSQAKTSITRRRWMRPPTPS
jgi:hypothetical protein